MNIITKMVDLLDYGYVDLIDMSEAADEHCYVTFLTFLLYIISIYICILSSISPPVNGRFKFLSKAQL